MTSPIPQNPITKAGQKNPWLVIAQTVTSHRVLITVLTGIGIALGVTVAILASDVILGVIAGAGFLAVAIQLVKLWTGHRGRPIAHH